MSDHPKSKAVASLIHRLSKKFTFNWAHDGEELIKLRSMKVSEAKKECLDVITSVDESHINIKNKETGKNSTLFLTLYNGKDEIVCDYTSGDSDLEMIVSQHSDYWEGK
jgi:hypothetical protein